MGDKMRILVVDDDNISLCVMEDHLTKAGFEVVLATDGKLAFEAIKSEKYDLIITDMKMPRMDGIELLKRVKVLNPDIGIIIVTAFGEVNSYLDAKSLGAFEYLNKPIKTNELMMIIKKFRKANRFL